MRLLGLLLVALILATPVHAQRVGSYGKAPAEPNNPPNFDAIGIDQRLGETVPLDLEFIDEMNQPTTLGSCVGGKPTILVLAYYRCPQLCNQVLYGLVDALKLLPGDVGDRFNVVVVSFDPKDRHDNLVTREKKKSFLEPYGRPGSEKGWHFLAGEKANIDELCKAVGFRYEYDKVKRQYNHASGIMILTPYGKISKYFFGIDYRDKAEDGTPIERAKDLQSAIEGAGAGNIGKETDPSAIAKLLCYEYNPETGRYTVSVMKVLRIIFGTMVLIIAVWLIRAWRRPTRKAPTEVEPVEMAAR